MSRAVPKVAQAIKKILMVRPTHFDVKYSINPWMDVGVKVDKKRAAAQWETLRQTIEDVGGEVHVMDSTNANEWPDIVFAANAAIIRGNKAYLANFMHKERQGEKEYYEEWFTQNGFKCIFNKNITSEGAGDALWAGKGWNTLFCGVGPRTDVAALADIAHSLDDGSDFKVMGCRLIDDRFYHIDVGFCPLEEQLAVWYPGAFDAITQHNMKNEKIELVPIDDKEAARFACNAVVVGKNVILHQGNESVAKKVEKLGYTAHLVDMSEFLKAGGSAKCCTLQLAYP